MQPFFAIRVLGESLVTTFTHRHQVASWAPLHGGLRSDVSHVLIHRLNCIQDTTTAARNLRQAAGRLGLRGTLVGMATTVDPNPHGVGVARNGDLSVFAISLTQYEKPPTDARLGLPESSPPAKSTCLLLIINLLLRVLYVTVYPDRREWFVVSSAVLVCLAILCVYLRRYLSRTIDSQWNGKPSASEDSNAALAPDGSNGEG